MVGVMRIVVLGTGTDVGKTHVVSSLVARLVARGHEVLAWKPVSAGGLADPEAHARAGARVVPPAYALAAAVSPHLAARLEGRAIDLAVVKAALEAAESARTPGAERARVTIVEGAGGVFSPLGPGLVNADLVAACAPARVLLVAPDRLGVLHDVRATLLAAGAVGLAVEAVVLSAVAAHPGAEATAPGRDASAGTNAAELAFLGFAAPAATFPRAPVDAPETAAAADATLAALALPSVATRRI